MNGSPSATSVLLDEIFAALAASDTLRECIVYKGARVLNAMLGTQRQSLDLDANLTERFVREHAHRNQQRDFILREVQSAVTLRFSRHVPIRYDIHGLQCRLRVSPPEGMGWYGFVIVFEVADLLSPTATSLRAEVEITAPEPLMEGDITSLLVDGHEVQTYALQRIAGEKYRAFLSSLPGYRHKLGLRQEAVRARDLFDLVKIAQRHPPDDTQFWLRAGRDFRLACQARYIDCEGISTFTQDWPTTRRTYELDPRLASVPFQQAQEHVRWSAAFFEREGILPFQFSLPPSDHAAA